MIKPIILAKGNFQPKDLITTVSESNRRIDPTRENQLDALWIEKERNAKEKGKLIYNGLSYRLNSLKIENNKLILDFGIFDFKTRECLPETQNYYETTEEFWRKGCHTLATVKTSDGKYLMVELSGKSMNKNPTDFLGGIMETEPAIKSGNDIFNSLYKELEEEAFIFETDIAGSVLKMVYINGNTNVGFYFEVLLKITSDQIQKTFDDQTKEIDIKSLKVMSRSEYINVLENHNPNKQFLAKQIEI
ncbi:MAG: hypothetical protein FJZ43_04670 [Candidatus Staskawiczbacteria bacterium]|nr:hypothetical protein [Candidatus Staskawiczbacteria bacterium]